MIAFSGRCGNLEGAGRIPTGACLWGADGTLGPDGFRPLRAGAPPLTRAA